MVSTHLNILTSKVMNLLNKNIHIVSRTYLDMTTHVTATPISNEFQMSCILQSVFLNKVLIVRLDDQNFGELLVLCDVGGQRQNILYLITSRNVYRQKEVSKRLRSYYIDRSDKNNYLNTGAVKYYGLNISPDDYTECYSL